jgi:hypothetical protein
MYDYYLGGTANTQADRDAVERIKQVIPEIGETAWANRGFLQRAVRRMANDWGVKQFIDIGAGLPTQRNTHEVVADAVPDGRVVYVDNDPQVIERGRRILGSNDSVAVVLADLRQPQDVLDSPETQRLIKFDEPVGLLMVAVTQFVLNEDDPWALIKQYLDAVASGSYLALSAPTNDRQADRIIGTVTNVYKTTTTPGTARSKAEIERFFDGLEIVPPYEGAGAVVAHVGVWDAEDPVAADDDGSRWFYAAVGRKP